MRAARLFLGVSASFAVIASVASGCGSSTSNPPADSGTGADVTMEAAPMEEAAVEAAVEAAAPEAGIVDAACVPDASIQSLPVPDASLGDAGATAATCLACVESSCSGPSGLIAKCNANCACVDAFEQFEACMGSGMGLQACVLQFSTLPNTGLTFTDFACAIGCAVPSTCGYAIPTGGDSGSMQDSATTGDGPTE